MANNRTPSSDDSLGGTSVDLGDDLLEKTVVLTDRPVPKEPRVDLESNVAKTSLGGTNSIPELLQNAKILTSEGFVEDAKKILRKVLILDSGNVVARQSLNEIQDQELKQILGQEERRRSYRKEVPEPVEIRTETLMRELDRDLNLGIFLENRGDAEVSTNPLSLFRDPELLEDFCLRLERDLDTASVQDRIDLGIAFLEIELYPVAIRLFLGACRKLSSKEVKENELILSATSLLAFSLLSAAQPYEAILRIQPILRDADIQFEKKVELFYLMGRTYESLGQHDVAHLYYQMVAKVDPRYRDLEDRLGKKTQ